MPQQPAPLSAFPHPALHSFAPPPPSHFYLVRLLPAQPLPLPHSGWRRHMAVASLQTAGAGWLPFKAPLLRHRHRCLWSLCCTRGALESSRACTYCRQGCYYHVPSPPRAFWSHEASTSCLSKWNEVVMQAPPARNGRRRREEGLIQRVG